MLFVLKAHGRVEFRIQVAVHDRLRGGGNSYQAPSRKYLTNQSSRSRARASRDMTCRAANP